MNTARVARLGLRATQQFSVPRTAALNGLRTYATPAQNVKPPVALFGVDGTYATALVWLAFLPGFSFNALRIWSQSAFFSRSVDPAPLSPPANRVKMHIYTASAKSSALDQTSKALSSLAQTFKADRKLTSIIAAPTLSASDKQQIIQELQKIAGNDKGDIIKNFLQTLAENNRLGLLEGICQKFETLMGAHRGEMEVTITSAQELDNKTINRLEKAVSKHELSQGKKLKIVTKVNPEIVGGLVVEIGDRTIDLSVSSKLAKLNKALTDAL
ncbi:ATP synthase delta subunit-domain-containing protein [Aspergillus fumigatus]|nr:hypothetical protein CDV58_02882 [Aspergillus fumigatus]